MRFAYIDSQGTEVPIPSVDALALRIELGAIGEDTQLYDAQADRWGPAHTHEIFHTLSRRTEEDGFVAPPPPVAPPGEPQEDEPEPAVEETELDVSAEEDVAEAAEEPADSEGFGLSFTLTEGEAEEGEPAAEVTEEEGAGGGFAFDIASDLAGTAAPDDTGAEAEAEEEEAAAAPGGFDFGDLGSLELESSEPEPEEPVEADVGGFEAPLDLAGDGEEAGGGLGMELEQPMSEFTPESPPAWMEQDGPAGAEDEGALDFARPAAEERGTATPEGEEETRRERPTPRTRPSPPRRRRRFPVKALVGLLVLGGLGYGGYYYWPVLGPMIQERLASSPEEDVPVRPPVVIPDIPAELLPRMREIGQEALQGAVTDLQQLQASMDLPAQPRNEWLAGAYLANASRFVDVEEYWLAVETWVDTVRAMDTQLFHEQYVQGVRRAGVPEDTAAMLVERADSGFMATAEARFEAYALLDDLVDASLDLHQFLLDNEEGIVHEPASAGLSRDPLFEAVAEDESVSRQMRQNMSRITQALSSLGTLDRVTTERLTAVLYDRILSAGFR